MSVTVLYSMLAGFLIGGSRLLRVFRLLRFVELLGFAYQCVESLGTGLLAARKDGQPAALPTAPLHPRGSVSLDSQSPAAPYSTAISDSQQFARRYAPSNCVRCCDSSSLATASGPPIACAMKVSHWIFARLRLPTNPVRLLFPSKEGRLGCFGGFAAVGILTTLTIKRATDSAGGSFLGRRRSCRGPPSQLQVGAYTAHKSAFLLSIDAAHGAEDS